jgi:hypothetical protein
MTPNSKDGASPDNLFLLLGVHHMRTTIKQLRSSIAKEVEHRGLREVSRVCTAHHATITRFIRGGNVSDQTLVKLSRISPKVRTAREFESTVSGGAHLAPIQRQPATSWDLQLIRNARDMQLLGNFELPVQLATALRTDDALFTGYHNRIAPQEVVNSRLIAYAGARGEAVQRRALAGVHCAKSVIAGIEGTLVNHGIAIGYLQHEPNANGTAVEFRLEEWPLEFVRWDPSRETLITRTRNASVVDICHGDSRWVVFRKFQSRPWAQNACLLPAAFIWAAHAEGLCDWAGASRAHGLAKLVGELPEGIALLDGDTLSAEARAFLSMLQGMVSGDASAGIRPAGAKTDFLANGSTAWQVFAELLINREKAAARVYCGTDATLGAAGGAPGVDIAALFKVAATLMQGDFNCLEAGLNTGVYEPWAAINEGSSRYAPRFEYQIPDPDEDAKQAEKATKRERLMTALDRMRAQKFMVDQAVVNQLAAEYGVHPAPVLAPADAQTSTLILAPTDVAKVVRVREARASQGLPPFGDERDDMTLGQLDSWIDPKIAPAPAPAPASGVPS